MEKRSNKLDFLNHSLGELKGLEKEASNFLNSQEYMYANTFINFIDRYNHLIEKYSADIEISIDKFNLYEHEFSESKKTIRNSGINRFKITIENFKNLLDGEIYRERETNKTKLIPSHQMRKCLKIGVEGCPQNPVLDKNKVFIGMAFDNKYMDSYQYGVKLALETLGYRSYRADNEIENRDIMCKICHEMQTSKYLIFNISGLNPNVMLELGLSYGLGKETIIIKDKETKAVSDIASIEYIEYEHAYDLQCKLMRYFQDK